MQTHIARFIRDEDGTTATEYAVMLAAILIGIILAVSGTGSGSGNIWQNNATKLNEAF